MYPKITIDTIMDTTRCILRYARLKDSPRILSAFTSDRFPDDLPLGQRQTLDEAREWIEDIILSWEAGRAFI